MIKHNTFSSMILAISSLLIFVVIGVQTQMDVNKTSEIEINKKSQILSRRKRFLIFPEGSSFQLVFCTTYQMIIPIGDIFLYGNTIALAWELPQDPYSPFNHHADPLHRRIDTKVVYYTDDDGKIIGAQPYHSLGVNGEDCVKKTLCLMGQAKERPQGMFFQEIMKAVFTLPTNSLGDEYSEYDAAYSATKSCDVLYPDCSDSSMDSESDSTPY